MSIKGKIHQLRESEASSILVKELERSNYDQQVIEKYLSSNRTDIVELIASAIEKGRIDIDSNQGKSLWRTVIEYYREHAEQELFDVEEIFWEVTVSPIRQTLFEMKTETIGGLYKLATLGLGSLGLIDNLYQRKYEKHMRRLLYE